MFEKLSQFLVPIAGKLNNNRYLTVLRDAFMLSFPLTIFGSIFVTSKLVDIPALQASNIFFISFMLLYLFIC